MIECTHCHLQLNPPTKLRPPFYCSCGTQLEIPEGYEQWRGPTLPPPQICQHRGEHLGQASCACGAIYRCNLLQIYCGNKQPLEFADFHGTILTGENFRCCRGCDQFSTRE